MGCSVTDVSGVCGLRLNGELDAGTIELLKGPLERCLAAGGPILIDMTALRFIDSVGIRELVKTALVLDVRGWCLVLHTADNGEVGKALELMGLNTAPNIHIIEHRGAHTRATAADRGPITLLPKQGASLT